jgi:hypothetical protein
VHADLLIAGAGSPNGAKVARNGAGGGASVQMLSPVVVTGVGGTIGAVLRRGLAWPID